jgi:protein scribble
MKACVAVIKTPDGDHAVNNTSPMPVAASSPRPTVMVTSAATIIPDLPPSPEPGERRSTSGDDQEEESEDDELHIERHVDFTGIETEAELNEKESKLRRRDTPHHLKGKRIGSADPDSAEEKVRQILAQSGGTSMDEATTSAGSEEVSEA